MSRPDPLTTNVVACHWQRSDDGWRLWVRGRPEIAGEGVTFAAAQDQLIEAIMVAARDLDAIYPVVPEFDPPIPPGTTARRYLNPELFMIQGDAIFEIVDPTQSSADSAVDRRAHFNALFRDGLCVECLSGRGARTAVPLDVGYVPPRVDAGFVRAPFGGCIQVFSERFLALLRPVERERLTLRPIETLRGVRRKFYELCGEPDVGFVGVRELDADGFECPACHHREVSIADPRLSEEEVGLDKFVCAADLPQPLPSCFTIGQGNQIDLVLTRDRWDELRSQRGARGIYSTRLGVVSEAECDRLPRVRSELHRCGLCSEWPEPCTLDDKVRAVYDLPARMCSQRNFTWLIPAAEAGYLQFSRQTMDVAKIWDLVARYVLPERTEFVSFRCPSCWRLGQIILTRDELKLVW